jgi:hypothetical protein
MTMDLSTLTESLLPLLRTFVRGEYGIALGGAHAKGVDDASSDLDLYVFARHVLSLSERERLCQQFSAPLAGLTSWELGPRGESDPFLQAGTDFYFQGQKVEVWLRGVDFISGILAECQAGIVRRDWVTWTVMGFFNHCTLSDLSKMSVLEDPARILSGWQEQVRRYPPRMKRAILDEYLAAAHFWPENFHYKTAVARCDVLYTSGIVRQVLENLVQVLFALNEEYFPGEKKLALALEHLPLKPDHFPRRAQALVFPSAPPEPGLLEAQRQELARLVAEVDALVKQNS